MSTSSVKPSLNSAAQADVANAMKATDPLKQEQLIAKAEQDSGLKGSQFKAALDAYGKSQNFSSSQMKTLNHVANEVLTANGEEPAGKSKHKTGGSDGATTTPSVPTTP